MARVRHTVLGVVNLSYSERVWDDWRREVRNRQAAVTLRQISNDRDLKLAMPPFENRPSPVEVERSPLQPPAECALSVLLAPNSPHALGLFGA